MTEPIWQEIPGFGGRYRISNYGEVLSYVYSKPRLLRASADGGGYLQLLLWKPGAPRGEIWAVHRLVATTFLADSQFEGAHVRHLDGTRNNNFVGNLAWGTASENMQDRIRHGTNPQSKQTHCKRDHEFTPENTYWRKNPAGELVIRSCLTCRREQSRLYARRKSAETKGDFRPVAVGVDPNQEAS